MPPNPITPGDVYERLTVVATGLHHRGERASVVRCLCGIEKIVLDGNLRGGRTRSCGCLFRDWSKSEKSGANLIHGMTGTREHSTWLAMLARCANPNAPNYHLYGGRGITICDRWRNSFEAFYDDMGARPAGQTLDRINNDGDYEPGNCRWATAKEQGRNRRSNRMLTFRGRTQCVAAWADEMGINMWSLQT